MMCDDGRLDVVVVFIVAGAAAAVDFATSTEFSDSGEFRDIKYDSLTTIMSLYSV